MTLDDDVRGYPEEFIESLHPRYECPICFLALREPLQLPCGHRFCEICFSKVPERYVFLILFFLFSFYISISDTHDVLKNSSACCF